MFSGAQTGVFVFTWTSLKFLLCKCHHQLPTDPRVDSGCWTAAADVIVLVRIKKGNQIKREAASLCAVNNKLLKSRFLFLFHSKAEKKRRH